MIFYRPEDSNFSGEDVVAPALRTLVDIDGASGALVTDITFQGIQFHDTVYTNAMTPKGTIDVNFAQGIVIEASKLMNTGDAIVFQNTTNSQVIGNELMTFSKRGIALLEGSDNNLVAGNWAHDGAVLINRMDSSGIVIKTSTGNVLANNLIENMPGPGMSIFGPNNIIEYNEIRNVNLEKADSGAIYLIGRPNSGNIIRYNVIDDPGGLNTDSSGNFIIDPPMIWGIYLDEHVHSTKVYGNLVTESGRGGVIVHLGGNNVIGNNIFLNGDERQISLVTFANGNVVEQNIFYFENTNTKLMTVLGGNQQFDSNLYWNPNGTQVFSLSNATPKGSFADWQASGQDTNSLIADPLFADLAAGNYSLSPDSPVFGLGFVDISDELDAAGLDGYDGSTFGDGGVNEAPVAQDDVAAAVQGVPLTLTAADLLANDSDADGDNLTITGVSDGAHGTVVDNGDGSVTYMPNPDFFGIDSFDYIISDGRGGTDTASVSIVVEPVNDAPSDCAGLK